MTKVTINNAAPVVGHAEAVIGAPVELVWDVLSDLGGWPKWNPSVSRMNVRGRMDVGTTFEWVGGGSKITSRLEEIDRPSRIAWSGRTMGIRAVHVWEFSAVPGGTFVKTGESFDGLPARLLPGPLRKMLDKALRDGMDALKIEAESRQGDRGHAKAVGGPA